MSIFTRAFWLAAAERAIKSAAQGAILGGVGAVGFNALDGAVWLVVLSAAVGAALLSILTSVGSDALTGGAGPSLTNAEVTTVPETAQHRRDETGATTMEQITAVVIIMMMFSVLLVVI